MNDSAIGISWARPKRLLRWISIPPLILTLWHWFWTGIEWIGNAEVVRNHLPAGLHVPTMPRWTNTALPLIGIAWLSLLVLWPKNSERAPTPSNLRLIGISDLTFYRIKDEFTKNVFPELRGKFPQHPIVFAEIKNASDPKKAVGTARHIKAELLVTIGNREEIFGPLAWTETIANTVSIEMGDTKEIILAVRFARGFIPEADSGPQWRLALNPRPSIGDVPGAEVFDYRQLWAQKEAKVRLNLLHVESGKMLHSFKGKCQWDEGMPVFTFQERKCTSVAGLVGPEFRIQRRQQYPSGIVLL